MGAIAQFRPCYYAIGTIRYCYCTTITEIPLGMTGLLFTSIFDTTIRTWPRRAGKTRFRAPIRPYCTTERTDMPYMNELSVQNRPSNRTLTRYRCAEPGFSCTAHRYRPNARPPAPPVRSGEPQRAHPHPGANTKEEPRQTGGWTSWNGAHGLVPEPTTKKVPKQMLRHLYAHPYERPYLLRAQRAAQRSIEMVSRYRMRNRRQRRRSLTGPSRRNRSKRWPETRRS